MESSPCANETCPAVASCISKEHVCSTSFPFTDESQAIMQCLQSSNVCPHGYKCQSGYCCIDVPLTDGDFENLGDDNVDDIPFFNDIFGPLDVDSIQECNPCEIQRCDLEVCNYPEPVKCVADNCSCTIAFEDLSGRPVQCEVPPVGEIPGLSGIPKDVTASVDLPSIPVTAEVKEMIVVTAPKMLITVSSTQVESLTLQSFDNGNRKDTTVIFIVGAFGVLVLLAAMGYAAYKIHTARIARQNQKVDKDINEVKVPLKDMSTHNNNEVKITEKLMNGHSAGEDP